MEEHIRWLVRDDMPEVAELEKSCFSSSWTREQFDKAWSQDWFAGYGIFRDSEIIGYITLSVLGGELEVLNIALRPEERGKGLSKPLMSYALKDTLAGKHRARKQKSPEGWETAVLEVRIGNIPARALYSRLGFVQCGLRKQYYTDGEDAVVMTLMADNFLHKLSQGFHQCEEKIEN